MSKYVLAEPGVDPLVDPLPLSSRKKIPGLLILGVLLAIVAIFGVITRRASGSAPPVTATLVQPTRAATKSPTPTTPATETPVRPTQTPWVITKIVEKQVIMEKKVTEIHEREVTVVVERRWPVVETQIVERERVITATRGPTQTPWIVIATSLPTLTSTATLTQTQAATSTATATPTATTTTTATSTP